MLMGGVAGATTRGQVSGAVHAVAPHPTDPNVVYVGAVNGGIWRTGNAQDQDPDWTALGDGLPSPSIGALAFDPAGAALAVGRADGPLDLYRRTAGQLVPIGVLDGHAGGTHCVAIAPDGIHLASGGEDGALRIWEWPGATLIAHSGQADAVRALAWTADGSYVAHAARSAARILAAPSLELRERQIVYRPFYLVPCVSAGERFRVLVDGVTGRFHVLGRSRRRLEDPLTPPPSAP